MTKSWTPERRAAQAARIRETRPWEKSTGPRTAGGKKRSSQNALKHGNTRAILKVARKSLRLHREFMALALASMNDLALNQALAQADNEEKKKRSQTKDLKGAQTIPTHAN